MMVEIKSNPMEYTISQLAGTMNNGDLQLSWNFNRASHFLIVAHPVRNQFDLEEDMVPWLQEKGDAFLESRRAEEDDVLWILLTEREFLAKKNKFMIQRGKLRSGVPYKIVIYPCRIEDKTWEIYKVPGDANVHTVPVVVPVEIAYKKAGWFGKPRFGRFRVRFDVEALEGVLRYKPSCSRCQFPVSVESMKRAKEGWLWVQLPSDASLNILVAPEYKAYYNIRVTES